MAKRVKIPGRLESAETGNIVTGADAIMDDEKGKTQVVINSEVDAAIINLAQGKQDNLTFDNAPTEGSPNPVTSAGVYTADKVLSDAIEAILLLIPSAASALNKLVDMQTMNSSIATATASFKGTYNLVSDLHLGVDATHEQICAALDALSLGADNNDYAFVQVPNSATAPMEISKTERYKFNGENWLFEYDLNNSGFTQGQWNAINSGITALLVGKLSALPTNEALVAEFSTKQNVLTFDNTPTAGSPNPVKSGGVYARNNEIVALINALDAAKQDVLTFDNAPVQGSPNPVKSGGVYTAISAVQAAIVALDAAKQNVLTFDSTPTLGSPNPVTSSGIKTQLNRIDGNITTLNDLYEALTQSALVVVQPTDTWPVASPATSTIYRVVDRVNTPPQYYSDYMWNGTAMVLMATYDNAIDDVPTANSNNLVKSGGVYNNIYKESGNFKWLDFSRHINGIYGTREKYCDSIIFAGIAPSEQYKNETFLINALAYRDNKIYLYIWYDNGDHCFVHNNGSVEEAANCISNKLPYKINISNEFGELLVYIDAYALSQYGVILFAGDKTKEVIVRKTTIDIINQYKVNLISQQTSEECLLNSEVWKNSFGYKVVSASYNNVYDIVKSVQLGVGSDVDVDRNDLGIFALQYDSTFDSVSIYTGITGGLSVVVSRPVENREGIVTLFSSNPYYRVLVTLDIDKLKAAGSISFGTKIANVVNLLSYDDHIFNKYVDKITMCMDSYGTKYGNRDSDIIIDSSVLDSLMLDAFVEGIYRDLCVAIIREYNSVPRVRIFNATRFGVYVDNSLFVDIIKGEGTRLYNNVEYFNFNVDASGNSIKSKFVIDWDGFQNIAKNISGNLLGHKVFNAHDGIISSILSNNKSSDVNFGVGGDSITEGNQWSYQTTKILNFATHHNCGVGSSTYACRKETYNGVTYSTQEYDDPNFAGISAGWEPITSAEEAQKRANNCAKVHIQKFISEVEQGLYPAPDIFCFAYGTNDSPSHGQSYGNVEDAISTGMNYPTGDLLYTMTGAMKWCIQKIKQTYPNCLIFVMQPIQCNTRKYPDNRGNDIKMPLIKGVSEALSVHVIDMYNNCGISDVLMNGAPDYDSQYLRDGLHPNLEGQKVMGRYVASQIVAYLL